MQYQKYCLWCNFQELFIWFIIIFIIDTLEPNNKNNKVLNRTDENEAILLA